jgi:hypothetical protein
MMCIRYHHDVRTTLTLDEDVAARLKAETRRTGQSFRQVVNECLRRGLLPSRAPSGRAVFKIHARDLGALRPGLTLDNIADLLDVAEGPLSR